MFWNKFNMVVGGGGEFGTLIAVSTNELFLERER
jgi:hypothetical protein